MTPGTSFGFTFLDIQEGGKPFQCFSYAGLLYRRTSEIEASVLCFNNRGNRPNTISSAH